MICQVVYAYLVLLFARVVISWFPISPDSFVSTIYGFLYAVTEPVLGPIRRVVPPVGVGGMGLDLAPVIVIMGIYLIQGAFC